MARLSAGGLIDRSAPLSFTFDGRSLTGFQGDTLASALLANDVHLVGRSFKYHRPRGILTAGPEEPNALVELRTGARREPNTKATTVELYDGLVASSQNRWPSLNLDLLSVSRLGAPILTAGFYYKTFMWPASFWEKVYEPMIRRAAGLGRAATDADPDSYEKAHAFADTLVIGSGPAGLTAALAAGRARARVILAEQDFRLGGRLLSDDTEIDGLPGSAWAEQAVAELAALPNVTLMPRTAIFGAYDSSTFGAIERVSDHLPEPVPFQPRQRLWSIVAKRSILASGATERPIVFGDNDRPGIMLASAAVAYLRRFVVTPCRDAAVFTNNDSGWRSALALARAGMKVSAVIDVRPEVAPELLAGADRLGIRLILGGRVTATRGRCLTGLRVETAAKREWIHADGLLVSGGWSPELHLTGHHGGRPVWNDALVAFVPGTPPPGMMVAGSAGGSFGLAACLAEGAEAGTKAAEDLGFRPTASIQPRAQDDPFSIQASFYVEDSRGPAFVDQQNDVTAKDVAVAWREGFRSVEHLKRYTTLGMATDQGRTSNLPGLAIMAALSGQGIAGAGTTSNRPPHAPVAIAAFAGPHRGQHFRPTRLAPTHEWAEKRGAVFVEAGPWLRAQYVPQAPERDPRTTITREARAVREAVGFCDVSTLGKIDIQGPDAVRLLDRVYVNSWANLPMGRARYGVMLREDGMVMDDGTTSRLGSEHFLMTTTTANAVRVYQHLEFCLQVLWPDLDVQIASVTDQWAQVAVAGPRARDTVQGIVDQRFNLSNDSFPYMAAAELTVMGGVRARLFRLSFSGELGYELAVPARHGHALMEAVEEAGRAFGIVPYGTEALGVLRIEKGHVAGGELNGQTTAGDLGLGRMMSAKKDFIGRVMAQRPGLTDPDRPVLAGFRPMDRSKRLHAGAHFIGLGKPRTAEHDEGFMTSVTFSPVLEHWIGLGLIRQGPDRIGERVLAFDPVRSSEVEVEIVSPAFVDPEGVRLRV